MSLFDEQKRTRRLDNNLNHESARAVHFLASDPSFSAAIGPWVNEPSPELVANVRRHAIPKLAIAGIDHSKVIWEGVSEALYGQTGRADPCDINDEQHDSAESAPRG